MGGEKKRRKKRIKKNPRFPFDNQCHSHITSTFLHLLLSSGSSPGEGCQETTLLDVLKLYKHQWMGPAYRQYQIKLEATSMEVAVVCS